MDSRIDLAGLIVAICVAAYAAIMLDYLALNGLGLSIPQLRHLSMVAAVFLALPVAMDFLRARPDNIE
ncbi:hypothetical protein JQ604_37695 [Bradyrhizobium jicamae]|uniref:hypothetical protein n=1 Tax=Bradyrhizobium jicamae TaxID=280332 RepID=UPI001BAA4577|nr:hypothetical protein [Bradyrhizobium jicamae]MBR0757948.1 hypothetical protein [Bradyrhizobium jicamae]